MMVPGTAAANFADNALLDANVPTGPMTQLARRSRVYDAFSPRSLAGGSGLGNDGDCPDIAPYANLAYPGRCTNVPPSQQQQQSNVTSTNNPVVTYASAPVVDASISQQNADARFGLQLTLDRETQERIAAEAESQGRAQGYQVTCQVVENYAPAMPGTPGYLGYSTQCSINGGPFDQSAALLIRPGGWDIARVESQLPVSTYRPPIIQTTAPPTTTSTQQSQSQGGGNAQVTPPATQQQQGQPQTQQYPTYQTTNVPAGGTNSGASVISGAGLAEGMLSNPVVLIGLAAAAYFMFKGK